MDLPGTRDPAAWLTPIFVGGNDAFDEDDPPALGDSTSAVRALNVNLRTSLLAFSVVESQSPLALELTDGDARAEVLSTAFPPRVIASRTGTAVLRREADGRVIAEPYKSLLRATSLDGGLLVRLDPDSEPDDVTHAVEWILDVAWADLSVTEGAVAFTGLLRATAIVPDDGSIPAICVPDVGGYSRIVGLLRYTAQPQVNGLDWKVPVEGLIETDALVATTALARGSLALHVGFRGLLAPIGSLWLHGRGSAIHLASPRGEVTLLGAAGGRMIAAPGSGRRARFAEASPVADPAGQSAMLTRPERPRLVLASSSAPRADLLRASGIEPHIIVSHVDEDALIAAAADHETTDPHALTQLLADAKAADVARTPECRPGDVVLGADSMLAVGGELLGKARDGDEVRRRWRMMSGRTGTLVTGHALIDVRTGRWARAAVGTTVHFGRPDPIELEAYIASGEPLAVAGSCTIEALGAAFVDGIEGDHSNVIGLSLPTVRRLLAELGVRWTDLWH